MKQKVLRYFWRPVKKNQKPSGPSDYARKVYQSSTGVAFMLKKHTPITKAEITQGVTKTHPHLILL